MQPVHAVIFDLDGTLVDTLADLGTSMNRTLEKNGFPAWPLEAYRQMVGNGMRRLTERRWGKGPRRKPSRGFSEIFWPFTTGTAPGCRSPMRG